MIGFRHLCAFAYSSRVDIPDSLKTFSELTKRLLNKYLLDQMLTNITVNDNKIKEPETKLVVEILKPICEKLVKDIELSYFTWNAETRNELSEILMEQINLVLGEGEGFYTKSIEEFKYKTYENELVVDGVFVKIINIDPYMRIADPFSFICAAIKELDKQDLQKLTPEATSRLDCIMDAANNVAVYQKGFELGVIPTDTNKGLCKLLLIEPVENLERMTAYAFSMIMESCKQMKQALALLEINEFVRPMLFHLGKLTNETMVRRFMACLEIINTHRECDILLINKGVIVVLFKIILHENVPRPYKVAAFKVVQTSLARQKAEIKKFEHLIPSIVLERIVDQLTIKEDDWIDILNSDKVDVYLMWDKTLRDKICQFLQEEVNKIEQWVKSEEQPLWVDISKDPKIQEYINKGEIVVSDILLNKYISYPCVKIRVHLLFT